MASQLWGIHAGKTGDADALFREQNCIALGWIQAGDVVSLPKDREAYKRRIAETYPDKSPASHANTAGQLYRFSHEVEKGDYVAYPSRSRRTVFIGVITGDARYSSTERAYRNQRSVIWKKEVPRTHFSQGALHELGSAMSFFQVKTYAEEFLAALQDVPSSTRVLASETDSHRADESVGLVAESIEENTRDFIIKVLSRELKGHPFSDFVASLLGAIGYRTRVSPPGVDGGIDIIAHKDELGVEPPLLKIQVKSGEGSVGDPVVSALYGKVSGTEFGIVVTLGSFTTQARRFSEGKANLRLIDGDDLVSMVLNHYESLDARYQGLIPLKRVYIPEPVDEVD